MGVRRGRRVVKLAQATYHTAPQSATDSDALPATMRTTHYGHTTSVRAPVNGLANEPFCRELHIRHHPLACSWRFVAREDKEAVSDHSCRGYLQSAFERREGWDGMCGVGIVVRDVGEEAIRCMLRFLGIEVAYRALAFIVGGGEEEEEEREDEDEEYKSVDLH